jgi:hypothetical protein
MTEPSSDSASTGSPAAASTDVYPIRGGGWRATCDCGLTDSVDDQPAGWTWVIDHACALA